MSSFMYPDSPTRKMYGEAGRKAAAQAKRFSKTLMLEREQYASVLNQLKGKVSSYEKLPWYKKLWLAIREFFGHKAPIIN